MSEKSLRLALILSDDYKGNFIKYLIEYINLFLYEKNQPLNYS
jgi:hypothetical protein